MHVKQSKKELTHSKSVNSFKKKQKRRLQDSNLRPRRDCLIS